MNKTVVIEPYKDTIAYKEWLAPAERLGTVICCHGLGDTAGAFDIMAPVLANKGFRVLAIDLPGHGLSSHTGRYSLYHIAECLLRFITELDLFQTQEDIFLVSHSFSAEAAPFLAGTYPNLFRKIVQLDNPGPVDLRELTKDPFTNRPHPDYRYKLKKFYEGATYKKKRNPPSYESVEEAAKIRLESVPSFFRIDEQAAYNISKRAYASIDGKNFHPSQDPMLMKDNWPGGAGQICLREDVEALVENISAPCLLIKFDSWKEKWWVKAHEPLLKAYKFLECESVEGPHHAFAMSQTGEVCGNMIAEFFMREI